MPLAQCPRCKKMFSKTNTLICAACDPAEQADYKRVREILEESPGLNTQDVADKAEVPLAVVQRMLKDGALTFDKPTPGILCGQCGAPAMSATKRLCHECFNKLNMEVAKAQASIKQSGFGVPPPKSSLSVRQALDDREKR